MPLYGIDINPFKADLDLGAVRCDFVLEKATGGNAYVNPDCDNKIQRAIELGKLWGVFHYFGDGYNDNNPVEEADFFVDNILGYVGNGILGLDWERGGNPNVDRVDMALAWLNHVFGRTNVRPVIYMSMSIYQALDWSPVINAGYALWVASWPENNNIVANYNIDESLDPNPRWDGVVGDIIWQFTSTGRLDGYGGNLDCDIFYGTPDTWRAYARPVNQPNPTPTTTTTQTPVPDPTTTTTTVAPAPTTTTTTAAPENGDSGTPSPTTTTTNTTTGDAPPSTDPQTTTTQTTGQDSPVQEPGLATAIWTAIVAFVLAVFNRLRGVQ